ncbi:MAG UNVERIFIED_CONTAM: hypothetical protein LVT10_16225 [Anaerolineae bacterium]
MHLVNESDSETIPQLNPFYTENHCSGLRAGTPARRGYLLGVGLTFLKAEQMVRDVMVG